MDSCAAAPMAQFDAEEQLLLKDLFFGDHFSSATASDLPGRDVFTHTSEASHWLGGPGSSMTLGGSSSSYAEDPRFVDGGVACGSCPPYDLSGYPTELSVSSQSSAPSAWELGPPELVRGRAFVSQPTGPQGRCGPLRAREGVARGSGLRPSDMSSLFESSLFVDGDAPVMEPRRSELFAPFAHEEPQWSSQGHLGGLPAGQQQQHRLWPQHVPSPYPGQDVSRYQQGPAYIGGGPPQVSQLTAHASQFSQTRGLHLGSPLGSQSVASAPPAYQAGAKGGSSQRGDQSGCGGGRSKRSLMKDCISDGLVTTLMVQGIPTTYSRDALLAEWPHHDTYDLLYLPTAMHSNENLGAAFINFVSPEAARSFYKRWNKERVAEHTGKKPLSICAADTQGLEATLLHMRKNKTFRLKNPAFQPAFFINNQRTSMAQALRYYGLRP
eukprot:TRINITY_DN75584_c0_g1_i1.p1 TRINITY_DN75584_c0_g1~~TRINITY_DN75584_c0_g1_i1.p1  ORF type:complete len:439 (+),score=53.91 TRINITY_DN75584_c0_g1_i1:152-1468(+)